MRDVVDELGFDRVTSNRGAGVECRDCKAFYGSWDGAVIRSHRRRCPVAPRDVYEPAATGRNPSRSA